MAARRFQDNESSVSLFPFLSILACVIGVLTLMITSLALTSMGHDGLTEEEAGRATLYTNLTTKMTILASEVDRLEKDLISERIRSAKIASLENELDMLKQRAKALNNAKALEDQLKTLQAADKEKKARLADLDAEKKRLNKKLASLTQEMSRRASPSLNATLQIRRGSGKQKYTPFFVEAAGKGKITLYSGEDPYVFYASKMKKDKKFNDLLSRLSGKNNEQLVVLVRDDGIGTMHSVVGYANSKNVITGRLPLLGKGRVDLGGVQ